MLDKSNTSSYVENKINVIATVNCVSNFPQENNTSVMTQGIHFAQRTMGLMYSFENSIYHHYLYENVSIGFQGTKIN